MKFRKTSKSLRRKNQSIRTMLHTERLEDRRLLAAGDIAVFSDMTGTVAITTAEFDHDFDTTIRDNANSTHVLAAGTDVQLASGHHLVLYNSRFDATGDNRSEVQTNLNLAGTDLAAGWSQGNIRRDTSDFETITSGGAIVDVATDGDVLQLQSARTDTDADSVVRAANATAIQLVKLDDNWDYLSLSGGTNGVVNNTNYREVMYNETAPGAEIDTAAFAYNNGTGEVELKLAGRYLVFANSYISHTSVDNRHTFIQRLELDGAEVSGTRTTAYMRGNESTQEGAVTFGGIIEATAGQQLTVDVAKAAGNTNGNIDSAKTGLTIVKLPDSGEFLSLSNSGTQDLNPTSLTAMTFDEAVADATFNHTAAGSEITVQQDGDYLFLNTFFHENPDDLRTKPNFGFEVNSGGMLTAGQTARNNRDANADTVGFGNDVAGNWNAIALGLSANDNVELVSVALANTVAAQGNTTLQGVRLDTLFGEPPVISDLDGDIVTYNTGDGSIVIDQAPFASATDPDTTGYLGGELTVSFSTGGDAGEDELGILHEGNGAGQIGVAGSIVSFEGTAIGIVAGGGAGAVDLVVTFNAAANDTSISALLDNITYANTAETNPFDRAVNFILSDGDGATSSSNEVTIDMNLGGAIDTFVWDGSGDGVTFSQGANYETDPGSGPDTNDIVIFRTADPGDVDVGGTVAVGEIRFDGDGDFNLINGVLIVQTIDQEATATGSNEISAQISSPTLIGSVSGGALSLNNATNSATLTGGSWTVTNAELIVQTDDTESGLGATTVTLDNGTMTFKSDPPPSPNPTAANLMLWLDASDINGDGIANNPVDGAQISTWVDKSAQSNDAIITSGNASRTPTYRASEFNGRPTMAFDGGDYLYILDEPDFAFTTEMTIFAMAEVQSGGGTGNWEGFVTKRGENGKGWQLRRRSSADTFTFTVRGTSATDDPNVAGPLLDLEQMYTARFDNVRRNTWINGVSHIDIADNSTINDGPEMVVLGARHGNNRTTANTNDGHFGNHINADISEVLIYNTALSTAERLTVEAYLSDKYAIGAGGGAATLLNDVTVVGNSTIQLGAGVGAASLGDLTSAANATLNVDGSSVTFAGTTTLGGATTLDTTAGSTLILNNVSESVASDLAVSGDGTVEFPNDNSYTGTTTISGQATLVAQNHDALGDGANGTVVEAGGSLQLSAGNGANTEVLTLSGAGNANSLGALHIVGSNVDYNGAITLGGDATIRKDGGGDLEFRGGGSGGIDTNGNELVISAENTTRIFDNGITGSGSLRKTGNGNLEMRTTSNDYAGETVIDDGLIDVDRANGLGSDAGGTTVNGGGTLRLRNNVTVGDDLVLNNGNGQDQGVIRNDANTNTITGDITLNGSPRIDTDAGTTLIFAGVVSGDTLEKVDTGRLTLTQDNTFSNTDFQAGTLRVGSGNSLGGTTSLVVNSGQTFELDGTFNIDAGSSNLATFTFNGGALNTVSGTQTIDIAAVNITAPVDANFGGNGGTLTVNNDLGNGDAPISSPGLVERIYNGNNTPSAGNNLNDEEIGSSGGTGGGQAPFATTIDPVLNPNSLLAQTPGFTGVLDEEITLNGGQVNTRGGGCCGNSTVAVVWTGNFIVDGNTVPAGDVSFGVRSDDGSTVFVDVNQDGTFQDSERIIDNGGGHGNRTITGTVNLPAVGEYGIAIAYYQNGGGSNMEAKWAVGNNVAYGSQSFVNPTTQLAFTYVVQPDNSVIKSGNSTVVLMGNNTYNGDTNINAGTLVTTNDSSLGLSIAGTTVADGATLGFDGTFILASEPISIGASTLHNISGDTILSAPLTITSALGTLTVASDADLFTVEPDLNLQGMAVVLDGAGDTLINGDISGDGSGQTIPNGRFIRIQNNGTANRRLDVGELEVFAPGVVPAVDHANGNNSVLNPAQDLAFSGNGASLHSKGATSNFNGGHHGGNDNARFFDARENNGGNTPAIQGVGAFWIVDLGSSQDIGTVRAHQRNDTCCQDRLENFTISVMADNGGNPGAVVHSASFGARPATSGFGEVNLIVTMDNSVTMVGTGTATLAGNNSYDSDTTVQAGTLVAASNTALGDAAVGTSVEDGATLALEDINGPVTISNEALAITGTGAASQPGALGNIAGDNTIDASVVITVPMDDLGDLGIGSTDGLLTIAADIDIEAKDLIVDGAGDVTLSGVVSGVGNGSNVVVFDDSADLSGSFFETDNTVAGKSFNFGDASRGWVGLAGGPLVMEGIAPTVSMVHPTSGNFDVSNFNGILPGNPGNRIAATWNGYIDIPENATYRFSTISDDGSQMHLDGELVVFNNRHQGNTRRFSEDLVLTAGAHQIKLAWFEGGGGQRVRAEIQQLTGATFGRRRMTIGATGDLFTDAALTTPGLNASIYNLDSAGVPNNNQSRENLFNGTTGRPIQENLEQRGFAESTGIAVSNIDFNSGNQIFNFLPGVDLDGDDFAAYFTGVIEITSADTIELTANEAATVWLDLDGNGEFEVGNGEQVAQVLANGSNTSASIAPGFYDIAVAYEDRGGNGELELAFGSGGVIPASSFGSTTNVPVENSLTKNGAGTLRLTGANTYDGGTTVSVGTLLANNTSGSATGPASVTVESGSALGGDGSIAGAVTVENGGSAGAGDAAAGDLATTSGATLDASSTLTVELNGATAGTEYDQLVVTGTATITDSNLSASRLTSFVPAVGTEFVIVDNDLADAIVGTFSGLVESASTTIGGIEFSISYIGGDGNDVVLTVVAPTSVYVDDSWTGTATGTTPATSNPAGLIFGYNAFDVIQDGIDQVEAAGTVVVYGGSYADTVNVDKALTSISAATNSNVPADTGVTISGAVSIDEDATFDLSSADLSFTSTIDGVGGDEALSISGATQSLSLTGNVGSGTALGSLTTNTNANSPLTIGVDIIADGAVSISVPESAGGGSDDDLTIAAGATVQSNSGSVALNAGDDLTLQSGAAVSAATTIAIGVDGTGTDNDAAGSVVDISGALTAASGATITSGDDPDNISLALEAASGAVAVNAGDSADAIGISSTGSGAVTLDGQAGDDSYSVDLGDAAGGTITSAVSITDSGASTGDNLQITGGATLDDIFDVTATTVIRNSTETVNYDSNVEQLVITGGAGNDTFNVVPLASTLLTVHGNDPVTGSDPGDTISITAPLVGPFVFPATADGSFPSGGNQDIVWTNIETFFINGNEFIAGDLYAEFTGLGDRAIFSNGGGNRVLTRINNLFMGNFAGITGKIVAHAMDGNDRVTISGNLRKPVEFHGGIGRDYLAGGTEDDTLFGDDGNDTILTGEGDNTAYGGTGRDSISGRRGDDVLYGQDGADNLNGSSGNDILFGDDPNDPLAIGSDNLTGGRGDDLLVGGFGNDILSGGFGNDVLLGNGSNDFVRGNQGEDLVIGGAGSDSIYGESGIDRLADGTATNGSDEVALIALLAEWTNNANSGLARPFTNAGTLASDGDVDILSGGGSGDAIMFGGEDGSPLGGGDVSF
jgi:autotransporter-associated beta strand protein